MLLTLKLNLKWISGKMWNNFQKWLFSLWIWNFAKKLAHCWLPKKFSLFYSSFSWRWSRGWMYSTSCTVLSEATLPNSGKTSMKFIATRNSPNCVLLRNSHRSEEYFSFYTNMTWRNNTLTKTELFVPYSIVLYFRFKTE